MVESLRCKISAEFKVGCVTGLDECLNPENYCILNIHDKCSPHWFVLRKNISSNTLKAAISKKYCRLTSVRKCEEDVQVIAMLNLCTSVVLSASSVSVNFL